MKRILLILTLLFSVTVFSQEDEPRTKSELKAALRDKVNERPVVDKRIQRELFDIIADYFDNTVTADTLDDFTEITRFTDSIVSVRNDLATKADQSALNTLDAEVATKAPKDTLSNISLSRAGNTISEALSGSSINISDKADTSNVITGDSIINQSGTLVKNRIYTSIISTDDDQTLTLPAITKDDIGKRIEISNEYTGAGVAEIVDNNGISHRGFNIEKYTLTDGEEVNFMVVVEGGSAKWRMATFVDPPEMIDTGSYVSEEFLAPRNFRRMGAISDTDGVMTRAYKLKSPAGGNLVDFSNARGGWNDVTGTELTSEFNDGYFEHVIQTDGTGRGVIWAYVRDTIYPGWYTVYAEVMVSRGAATNGTVRTGLTLNASFTQDHSVGKDWTVISYNAYASDTTYNANSNLSFDFRGLNPNDTGYIRKAMVAPGKNVEYSATEGGGDAGKADRILQFGEYNPVDRVVDISDVYLPYYSESYILQSVIDWCWRTNKANAIKLRGGMRITSQITVRSGIRLFFESPHKNRESWSYIREDYVLIDLDNPNQAAFVIDGTPWQDQNLDITPTAINFENIAFYVLSDLREVINIDGGLHVNIVNCNFQGNDLARNAIRGELKDGLSDLALGVTIDNNTIDYFQSAGILGGGPAWRILGNVIMECGAGVRITGTYSGGEYRGNWVEDNDSLGLDVTGGFYFAAYDCYYENNGSVSGGSDVYVRGVTNTIIQGSYHNSNNNDYNIQLLDTNYAVTLIGVRHAQGEVHNWTPENRNETAKCFTGIALTKKGEPDVRVPDIMSCLELDGNVVKNSTFTGNYQHDSLFSSKIYLDPYGENLLLNSSAQKTTDGSGTYFKWTVDSIVGITGSTDVEVYEGIQDITGGTTHTNGSFTLGDTIIANTDYLFSFYKKDLDSVGKRTFTLTIGFAGDPSTYVAKPTEYSEGFIRYSVPVRTEVGYSAGTAFNIRFGQLDQGDVFALDGFQLQKGTRLSTYIKTGATKGVQENVEFVSDNPVEFTGGLKGYSPIPEIISFTTSRNIAATDIGNTLECTSNATLTIPDNFTDMEVGETVNLEAHGAATLIIDVPVGVTINGADGGDATVGNGVDYVGGILRKKAANEYVVL